jgi:hypothetical protein
LAGSRNTHVATLVERSSRFVMLVRVGGKDTESVVAVLSEQIRLLPRTMMDTLTWDRGPEMAAHKKFTVATDAAVYLLGSHAPPLGPSPLCSASSAPAFLSGEPFALSGVDLGLVDPFPKRLGRDIQIASYLRHWIALL